MNSERTRKFLRASVLSVCFLLAPLFAWSESPHHVSPEETTTEDHGQDEEAVHADTAAPEHSEELAPTGSECEDRKSVV